MRGAGSIPPISGIISLAPKTPRPVVNSCPARSVAPPTPGRAMPRHVFDDPVRAGCPLHPRAPAFAVVSNSDSAWVRLGFAPLIGGIRRSADLTTYRWDLCSRPRHGWGRTPSPLQGYPTGIAPFSLQRIYGRTGSPAIRCASSRDVPAWVGLWAEKTRRGVLRSWCAGVCAGARQ